MKPAEADWGIFGMDLLVSARRRPMRCCRYAVNIVLLTYSMDIVESSLYTGASQGFGVDF